MRLALTVALLLLAAPASAQGLRIDLHRLPPAQRLDLGLPSVRAYAPLSPERIATIGGLADAATTYIGLTRRVAGEEHAGYAHMRPWQVGLSTVGQLAVQKALTALIRKKYPRVADALAANTGAYQLALSAQWGQLLHGQSIGTSGYRAVNLAYQRALIASR